ncbi:MAG: N-acetylmuramoyl-L-alanine amidase [Candidatus Pacebacteria bacterium]|nr:N-acetylmuramoyl-L-alanine amidase [Candidatus Paceibacterota bacterium]
MKPIAIFGTGHGFNTPGKRSDGFMENGKVVLKENSVNEAVGNKLSFLYWFNKVDSYFITNEWHDVPLYERVKRERRIAKELKRLGQKSVFLSIHADAFHVKNAATGGRFFYKSEGGRKIAEHLTYYLENNGYDLNLRRPKQANFKMLRDTSSPAVLFEMGFMTTKSDLEKLVSDEFRNKTALLLFEGLQKLDL